MKKIRTAGDREARARRISRALHPHVTALVHMHGERLMREVAVDARIKALDFYRTLRRVGVPRTLLSVVFAPSFGLSWLSAVVHLAHHRISPRRATAQILDAISYEYSSRLGTLWGFFLFAEERNLPVTAQDFELKLAERAFFPDDVPMLAEALRRGIAGTSLQEPVPAPITTYLT